MGGGREKKKRRVITCDQFFRDKESGGRWGHRCQGAVVTNIAER